MLIAIAVPLVFEFDMEYPTAFNVEFNHMQECSLMNRKEVW